MATAKSPIPVIKNIDVGSSPKGTISYYNLRIAADGMGRSILIPVMIARGYEEGPVLGVTAAVHGNELNGIPVVQRLFKEVDPASLRGTLVGVPVMNVPGYLNMQRQFNDGWDLNRIMPGKPNGNQSEIYAYRLVDRIISKFDYLLDLHTASFGRVNSYYIRANMEDEATATLARLQNAQIILNSPAPDSTVRGTACELGAKAITLEVGDPNLFQKGHIRSGLTGIINTLIHLGMIDDEIELPDEEPVICKSSYWIYTDKGGILQVLPNVTQLLEKGDKIAILRDAFGDTTKEFFASEDGIVIGKHVQPVAQTGTRIIHFGIIY